MGWQSSRHFAGAVGFDERGRYREPRERNIWPDGLYSEMTQEAARLWDCYVIDSFTQESCGYAVQTQMGWRKERWIALPEEIGRWEFLVALHEIGHHERGHCRMLAPRLSSVPRYFRETEAWQWAREEAEMWGIEITFNDDRRIRSALSWVVDDSIKAGLRKLIPESILKELSPRYAQNLRAAGRGEVAKHASA